MNSFGQAWQKMHFGFVAIPEVFGSTHLKNHFNHWLISEAALVKNGTFFFNVGLKNTSQYKN
jgi:hypothetical protein